MPERLSRLQTSLPELNRVQDDHIRVLNPVLGKDALQDDGAWHYVGEQGEPPFIGVNWSNYAATGPWEVVRFRKDRFGRVDIEGLANVGTLGYVFVLPDGFRPRRRRAFVVMSNGVDAYVRVYETGHVEAVSGASWLSFDGISFLAETE